MKYQGYLEPSQTIKEILETNAIYREIISRNNKYVLNCRREIYPSITQVASEVLYMAGYSFYKKSRRDIHISCYDQVYVTKLLDITDRTDFKLIGDEISHIQWGFDDTYFVYASFDRSANTTNLVIQYLDGRCEIMDFNLSMLDNDDPFVVSLIENKIIFKSNHNKLIESEEIILEPVAQETSGNDIAKRTYPDLLKTPSDKTRFRNYIAADLLVFEVGKSNGKINTLLANVPLKRYSWSHTNSYLWVEMYTDLSSMVQAYHFGYQSSIINIKDLTIHDVTNVPVQTSVPPLRDSCEIGPRSFEWFAIDQQDFVVYFEAMDEGNPKNIVEFRDRIMLFDPKKSFSDSTELCSTTRRASKVELDTNNNFWIYEKSAVEKIVSVSIYLNTTLQLLYSYNIDDLYKHPGIIKSISDCYGQDLIQIDSDGYVIVYNRGHCPDGVFPSLDLMNIFTLNRKRIWSSNQIRYQQIMDLLVLKRDCLSFVYTDETPDVAPIVYLQTIDFYGIDYGRFLFDPVELDNGNPLLIASNSISYNMITGFEKEMINYTRSDGLNLSAELYLPAGYESGPKPVLIWAYPQDYNNKNDCGQVRTSKFTFNRFYSPLYWLAKGYVVVDDCDMPIVKNENSEANDNFVEQLQSNASAIIDYLKSRNLTDGKRIAIGGHSYGAFMVANLLSHTNLFTCGIARSGAYNRSLTPFGFQHEDRSFWDAKDVYLTMSPFMFANQMKTPILLIHGQADTNTGTYPMQSERYFEAIKGLQGTARLVLLPKEGHGYQAKESILHMLAEMENWLSKYNE